jgi:hypothetical protein
LRNNMHENRETSTVSRYMRERSGKGDMPQSGHERR